MNVVISLNEAKSSNLDVTSDDYPWLILRDTEKQNLRYYLLHEVLKLVIVLLLIYLDIPQD